MSLDYNTFVSQLANLMVVQSSDTNFNTFLPGCIDYAEGRIYRELDLLNETVVDIGTLSSGTRNVTMPTNTGTFIVVEEINVFTPAGTGSSNGERNPCQPVSKEFLDAVYGSQIAATGVPQFFAPITQDTFILGPSPDQPYNFEAVGIQRPTALSSSNPTTTITTYAPDLFMAAAMVFATGYQRDWGSQSDDPQMAQSWENQYKTLYKSAQAEQLRAAYQGPAWQADSPGPGGRV